MATQRKPVIVRRFSRDWFAGYAPASFAIGLGEPGELEILDQSGKLLRFAWDTVKWVCYVRDISVVSSDDPHPERLLQKQFKVRPRASGLWLRMALTDGDEIEGLAENDRSLIDGPGLLLTPPDQRSNTQRIYLPRPAIQTLAVVALIGTSKRAHREAPQPELFPTEE